MCVCGRLRWEVLRTYVSFNHKRAPLNSLIARFIAQTNVVAIIIIIVACMCGSTCVRECVCMHLGVYVCACVCEHIR